MPNKTRGVGLFTAENIVAVIRAIPESDGTYRDVARKAEQYGGNFHHQTIANWVRHGQADMEAGQPSTAYARFTKRYQDLIAEHCGPDNNRNHEFDRALEILKRTCECSNDKLLVPDGKPGEYLPGVPRLGRAATAQGTPGVTATAGKDQANPDGCAITPVNAGRCPTPHTRAPTQLAQQSLHPAAKREVVTYALTDAGVPR